MSEITLNMTPVGGDRCWFSSGKIFSRDNLCFYLRIWIIWGMAGGRTVSYWVFSKKDVIVLNSLVSFLREESFPLHHNNLFSNLNICSNFSNNTVQVVFLLLSYISIMDFLAIIQVIL